jgi:MFS family permease
VSEARAQVPADSRYKWIALSNTTLGALIVTIDGTIVIIGLPAIFDGIKVDPLAPGNATYMLWMIMGFLIVTAVLVVSLGRLGDIYGRVRVYNLGFLVFTVFSVLLTVTWMTGTSGALWLIVMRVGQGVGGAMLLANSSAIITDAFPTDQRGMALGISNIAGVAGSSIGLVLGGVLAPISWRLIFLVSVPIGVFGTVWAYLKLKDIGHHRAAKIDWWGNATFALGLILIMVAITTGIRPYHGHAMGWGGPTVLGELAAGVLLLVIFAIIETRIEDPMIDLRLLRIRAFTGGNIATLLTAMARGGLQFTLVIWLQGIWLPEHGYNFADTPLWAGIHMLPLIAGILVAGPLAGLLSDRFGGRGFATVGPVLSGVSFLLLLQLPVDFPYMALALILLLNGIGTGLFVAPNRAAVMNSLPPSQRGVGGAMTTTFQNSGQVLSIGIFFSLLIVGLSARLPQALHDGFVANGVPETAANHAAHLPPVTTLFATFLGYNPVQALLGDGTLHALAPAQAAHLTSRTFFPQLLTEPFADGLMTAFTFAFIACCLAAAASWMRGGTYYWSEPPEPVEVVPPTDGGLEPASLPSPAGVADGAAGRPRGLGVAPIPGEVSQ